MILAVIGGRHFNDYTLLKATLDPWKIDKIVSGGANGADTLAYEYARKRGITFTAFPPLEEEKRTMGFARAARRRNLRIVEVCEALVAFPTKNSRGTWHAVNLAKRMGKRVKIVQS